METIQIKRAAALLPDDIILGVADNGCNIIRPMPQSLRVMACCICKDTGITDINVRPDNWWHLEWFCRELNTPIWVR